MNKILSIGIVSAVLLIAGCAQKEVSVSDSGESTQETIQTAVAPAQETTPVEEEKPEVQTGIIDTVNFDFDKYNIRPDMQKIVDDAAQKIKDSAENANITITIMGNTDEFGSDEYNFALGTKRANTVRDALKIKGVNVPMSIISYGETNPVCTEKTKQCYAKNRRADISVKVAQ